MDSNVSSFSVCIDEQDIQFQIADQTVKPIVQQAHVIAFAQDACDLPARMWSIKNNCPRSARWPACDIAGSPRMLHLPPQVVIEGIGHTVFVQAEQDADAWRLMSHDHAHTLPGGIERCDIATMLDLPVPPRNEN
jgi:hypothetical protein